MPLEPTAPEPCPTCAAPCPCIVDAALINRPNTYECVGDGRHGSGHGMFEARPGQPGTLTRHRQVCLRCKHPECPCCGDWCDVVTGADICCAGKCVYPGRIYIRPDIKALRDEIDRLKVVEAVIARALPLGKESCGACTYSEEQRAEQDAARVAP